MIYLYSGTPGSGKSLHVARVIKNRLRFGTPVICNFAINTDIVKNAKLFNYVQNRDLTPKFLLEFSKNYFNGKRIKEDSIDLIIDEAQMMFNARSWDAKNREEWNTFFSLHRHYGYRVILIAQFDRMLDRQIRSLIEYEVIHRKISNFGAKGRLLCVLMLARTMFCAVTVWYPMKQRTGSEFFRLNKSLSKLYDTYLTFS